MTGPEQSMMNARDCDARAARCAANAKTAPTEAIAREFLELATQWRLMGAGALPLNPLDPLLES
jgi:hypothetical protein